MERRLSTKAATACENATGGRCRCRCGGRLHGARRTRNVQTLPTDDPHYAEPDPKPEAPLRRVVKADDRKWWLGNQITLECGHTVQRKPSKVPRRVHCKQCGAQPKTAATSRRGR